MKQSMNMKHHLIAEALTNHCVSILQAYYSHSVCISSHTQ